MSLGMELLIACTLIAIVHVAYPFIERPVRLMFGKALKEARSVWKDARWYEKLGICLLFVPIPGPIDEIVALLVIRRVIARRT